MFRKALTAGAKLPLWRRIVYGAPSGPHAFVALPLYMILPAFYAAHTKITLAEIGAVAALGRIFDAVCDPVIGYLSDLCRARLGTRKPFALGAMIFCALSATRLFQPPPDASVGYFALWSALLYVGFTMFEVPNAAWGVELSRDYAERGKIGVSVASFNVGGSFASYLLPIAMALVTGSTAISGASLRNLAWIYVFLFPGALMASILLVPNGARVETGGVSLRALAGSLRTIRPLQRFYLITLLWALGQGFLMSTIFIFMTDYLGLKAQFPFVMVALFFSEIVFLGVWSRLIKRIDRHRAWALCVGVGAVLAPAALLLPRGPAAFVPLLVLTVVRSFFTSPTNFLPSSVLGDVIDYDTLKSGTAKAGNLFALQMLLIKVSMATGGACAFFILDRAGYKVGGPNTPRAEVGLLAAYLAAPVIMHLAMAATAWNFPISRRRHKVIQERLEARGRRLAAAAAAPPPAPPLAPPRPLAAGAGALGPAAP
jgi:Na+/melibiose symporter-like transporter